ncbi:hypothetical protein FACS1894153_1520 [Bacteroidia bacterium]|nr:hypothetical protein FACS1894153_1520 [Bacteroidia bacterium]
MKLFQIIYILFFTSVLLVSCNDREIDISVLPVETNSGAKTFGCVVDDWIYVCSIYNTENNSYYTTSMNRYDKFYDMIWNNFVSIDIDTLMDTVSYKYISDTASVKFFIKSRFYISFDIVSPREKTICDIVNVYFGDERLPDGTIKITKCSRGIISGKQMTCSPRLKLGRFDVLYDYQQIIVNSD